MVIEEKNKITAYLQQLEDYFNSLKTFSADFVQVDRRGVKSTGYFLLKRPSRMKLYYRSPSADVLVAKDSKITHYNRDLKEKTITPAHASPLSFLLESKVSLMDRVDVELALEDDEVVMLLLSPKNQNVEIEKEGNVLFTFKKKPMTLMGWEIIDNRSDASEVLVIKIVLENIKINTKISNDEFEKLSS
ncbi:MAG: outer membrane lipoprotein carrier protein LolA [Holosporaceae bacterium]|nr:outer membrane lipoprotein carrier protein LolA [Holosporaceae bacterium]